MKDRPVWKLYHLTTLQRKIEMNILDVIALAKAGYKKKDIDELLKMDVPEEKENPSIKDKVSEMVEGKEEEIERDLKAGTHVAPVPEGTYEDTPPTPKTDPVDDEVTKLRKELMEAQKANINADMAGDEESDEEVLLKAIEAFM